MTYTTTAAWLDYASQRRDSVPGEAGPGDQEAALMRAEDYIRLHYVARFLPGLDLARADVAAALAEAVHLAASVEVRQPHAFTATFRYLNFSLDVIGGGKQVGRIAVGSARHFPGIGEHTATSREVRAWQQ